MKKDERPNGYDFLGRIVKRGDYITFDKSSSRQGTKMIVGLVVGFTKKGIRIITSDNNSWFDNASEIQKYMRIVQEHKVVLIDSTGGNTIPENIKNPILEIANKILIDEKLNIL